jgi:uncharacterized peroxidase-related enzyme
MTRLPLRTTDDAPDSTKPALIAAEKSNGYLPNLLRILANAPVALETYLKVSGINARGSLSVAEREAVQITAAAIHGCAYCVAGHSALAEKKARLDKVMINQLRERTRVSDPRLDGVARFTEAVITSRGDVSDDELARFKSAGFSDQAALEVVLGVSLATLCNFANNLAHGPLNEELKAYRWARPSNVGQGASPVRTA